MNASLPARPFNKRAFAASMAALTGATLPLSGWFCHVYQFAPMTVARLSSNRSNTCRAKSATAMLGTLTRRW